MNKLIALITLLACGILTGCTIEIKHESHAVDKNSLICSAGYPIEDLAKNEKLYQSYMDCVTQLDKRDNKMKN